MKKLFAILFLCSVIVSMLFASGAQEATEAEFAYPTKQVEILVPANPGGNTDAVPRLYQKYLEKLWGVPVVLTNAKGATAQFCIDTYGAEPDGYTLVTNTDSPFIERVMGGIPFEIEDLTIIGIWAEFPGPILVVNSKSGWNTLDDFVQACNAKPDTLTIATNYTGNTRIMAEMLKKAGINFRIVDSDGGSDRQAKILGGHVDAVLLSWAECKDYIASGELVALCCVDSERCETYPDIPTAIELGYDCVYPTRHFLSTTPGVDERIVKVWEDALTQISNDPEFQKEMWETAGAHAVFRNREESMAKFNSLIPLFKEFFE